MKTTKLSERTLARRRWRKIMLLKQGEMMKRFGRPVKQKRTGE